ncbi:MAG: glycosyltransferase family 39 protein [Caldilineales bacterium]|nr:glycosyltransferase family 39 protein [Caldilineales bacterium]
MAILSPATNSSQQKVAASSTWGVMRKEYWLGIILVGHFLLSFWYSVVVPPWEAHDEWAHYRYAAYVAENLRLPDPDQRLTNEFAFDEATQPPLYYVLAAIPMLLANTEDGYTPTVNPYASRGTGLGGVNFVLHDPRIEGWPWQGTILALHLGRLVSILISTAGLVITYALVRLLSPAAPEIALVATAIQAFAPQYVFIGSVMTNDILLAVLEAALLYLGLRLLIEGPTLRLTILFALIASFSLLTKYLALSLIPLAVLVYLAALWLHRRERSDRHAWYGAVALLIIMLLAGGLWIARNIMLTGSALPRDPVSQTALLTGLRRGEAFAIQWADIVPALQYGFQTFWSSFGWGNVGPPQWTYWGWLALLVGGLMGLVIWIRQQKGRSMRAIAGLLLLFTLAVIGFPLLRELLHGSQFLRGRYILAMLPIAAWVIAQGWAQISGRLWSVIRFLLPAWPALLSVAFIPLVIIPAYAPPAVVNPALAPGAEINAQFGDVARLLKGYIDAEAGISPGRGLPVTLTWEALSRTPEPMTIAIHLVGAGGESYGNITTYPGQGNAATSVWEPGVIFSETYWVPVDANGPTPAAGHIAVSLFQDGETTQHVAAADATGQSLGTIVRFGEIRIDPADSAFAEPEFATPDLAQFDAIATLTDALIPKTPQKPGWAVPVTLRWRVLAETARPFAVTVQLFNANGNRVAGSDGPPSSYLPTQLWRSGDRLHTIRWLDLPADLPVGTYSLGLALYWLDDLTRLPATDSSGEGLPDNVWPLGSIIIE